METYLDGTGYNTYGTGNQYPEVGYWILRGDTKLIQFGKISAQRLVITAEKVWSDWVYRPTLKTRLHVLYNKLFSLLSGKVLLLVFNYYI